MDILKSSTATKENLIFYTKWAITINIVLLSVSYVFSAITGEYPVLGSPTLLFSMSLYAANLVYASSERSKIKKLEANQLIVLLTSIQLFIVFLRAVFLKQIEFNYQGLSIALFAGFVLTFFVSYFFLHIHYPRAHTKSLENKSQ